MGVGGGVGGLVDFMSLWVYPLSSSFISLLGYGGGGLKYSQNEE